MNEKRVGEGDADADIQTMHKDGPTFDGRIAPLITRRPCKLLLLTHTNYCSGGGGGGIW